jgi:hypothetical protein
LGWGIFFVSKNIALVIFGRFYKICPNRKKSVFYRVSRILAFLFEGKRIKRNKKKTPTQTVSSIYKKIFSSIGPWVTKKRGRKVG